MKMVKKVVGVAMVVLMTCSMVGCGANSDENFSDNSEPKSSTEASDEVLNVGCIIQSAGIPALYAEEMGWFEEAGLNINIITFATGAPVNEAIAAGEIDVACSGFASVYSLANADCVWLADINTTGGMGLYAREGSSIIEAGNTLMDEPDILGSKETVRNAQVLEPLGTAVQYMTECYADKFGLAADEITQVNMEYASGYQAFQAGEGDLAAMNPPYSYNMEDEGYIKVCSFEDATGVALMDGCFGRREVCEKRKSDVQIFVNVLIKAMDALQDEEVRFEYTMKKYKENAQDFTEEQLRREFGDRDYVGTKYVSQEGYIFGEAWGPITSFLVDVEKITADAAPNVLKSFDASFVENATGISIEIYSE